MKISNFSLTSPRVLQTIAIFLTQTLCLWFISMPSGLALTEAQQLVGETWSVINRAYIDETFNHQNWWFIRTKVLHQPLNSQEEAYQVIDQMLASLDDPFTRLLRPNQYRTLQVSTSGELTGVGLQIALNPETGELVVIAPLDGSPAAEAGIQPQDKILEIDGFPTAGLSLDEAAMRMRGPIGTHTTLTIQRLETQTTEVIELVRDQIRLNPVFAELQTQPDQIPVGYIRLSQFSANATEEVANAVTTLEQAGAKAFVLDLRNNPGGLLQAGVEIARLWLDQGTIVYTVNRQNVLGNLEANGSALTQAPLAVLVNRGTASASEILAGALQDNHRAILVGEKTFGKGLIQSLFDLSDGSGLAVTVAKYETPNHHDINKLGIVPDQIIAPTALDLTQIATEADIQYQTAINFLNTQVGMAKVP
ncbi:MAG: PDZ domain-containing protein [Oscillatoriales cyanobacterium RM1_1_9]|nr:PDZ domain-containing protein [Oscillatoriales cyanobacterium RM2_1_1]NJO71399.1 PDZ domain-containing protein [Oscillatoriales cyanobacterium RM1_1_9]